MHYYQDTTINVQDFLAVVTVTCSPSDDGPEPHRIGVRTDGSLVFFNHDETLALTEKLRREAKLPPAHACGEQHRHWLAGRASDLCNSLREVYRHVLAEKRLARARQRSHCQQHGYTPSCMHCTDDPLLIPIEHRMGLRAYEEALAALERTKYRTSDPQRHHWRVRVVSRPDADVYDESGRVLAPAIEGTCERKWEDQITYNGDTGRWNGASMPHTEIAASITPGWLARVHAEGLAIVNGGLFVLDVLAKHSDDNYTLLVGKQSRGYGVKPAAAKYDAKRDKLHWL